jgi:hypothetical protein
VQATVRDYDETTRSGSVFLDDGTEAEFGATALRRSGLRLLRPGQRVRIARDSLGAITAVTLATFPLPDDRGGPPERAPSVHQAYV